MPLPKPLLRGTHRDYAIGHLIETSGARPTIPAERQLLNLVLPPWQRPEVWTMSQKQRFIEGIFLGLGCGFYVVNGQDWDKDGNDLPQSGWLLDGQQRISAIRDFLNGTLVVFEDVSYPAMERKDQLRFLRNPFTCIELDYTDNENTLKDLYDRLNFGGTPHTEQDRALPTDELDPKTRGMLREMGDAFERVLGTGRDSRILGAMIAEGVTALDSHISYAIDEYAQNKA